MTDFSLNVNQTKYGGWKSLSITKSLDQLAQSFDVGFSDQWSDQEERIPIVAGNEVTVDYGSQTIITGYVDDDSSNYSSSGRSLTIKGRSKTGDLVDCAAVKEDGTRQWRKVGLRKIAEDICDPFGIDVLAAANLGGLFRRFTIEEGETAFNLLQRAARMRGLLILTNADGDLVFSRVGTTTIGTTLKLGENILGCNHQRSMRNRFSQYTVNCQTAGTDETADSPKNVTLSAMSEDDGVGRYRPTVIMADNEDRGDELQTRADWERNVRAGESRSFAYTVRGWEHDNGLWEPNTLVRVVDDYNWLDAELLIAEVTFSRSEAGTTTVLTLKAKEAYDVQPLFPPAKPASQKKKSNVLGGWLAS